MPFAEHFMVSGTFTVPSTVSSSVSALQAVNCGFLPTRVQLINETKFATAGSYGSMYWWDSVASTKTNIYFSAAATTIQSAYQLTSGGISQYDGHGASPNSYLLGPQISGTNTAKATGTFTVSSTATLYPGATILMTRNSVNKQLGGVLFTIATIASSTTFTVANPGWMNTANFTDGAETFKVQLVVVPPLFYPANNQIALISQSTSPVVTTTTNTSLTVGQEVRVVMGVNRSFWGMVEADGLLAIVTAVSGNQVTLGSSIVGFDSSAFTAFAWPNATNFQVTAPQLIPVGSGPYPSSTPTAYNDDTLADATQNYAFQGFTVGASILTGNTNGNTTPIVAASDVIAWTAWRGDV